jgi:hypothetical protein
MSTSWPKPPKAIRPPLANLSHPTASRCGTGPRLALLICNNSPTESILTDPPTCIHSTHTRRTAPLVHAAHSRPAIRSAHAMHMHMQIQIRCPSVPHTIHTHHPHPPPSAAASPTATHQARTSRATTRTRSRTRWSPRIDVPTWPVSCSNLAHLLPSLGIADAYPPDLPDRPWISSIFDAHALAENLPCMALYPIPPTYLCVHLCMSPRARCSLL